MLAFARRQELKPEPVDIPALVARHDRPAAALARPDRSASRRASRRPAAGPAPTPTSSRWRCSISPSTRATPCPSGGTITIAAREQETVELRNGLGLRAGTLCPPVGHRHRRGHGRGDAGARDRAVLHDQGRRQGHRPRPVDGARPGRAVRRPVGPEERAGRGHDGRAVAAGGRRRAAETAPMPTAVDGRFAARRSRWSSWRSTTTRWC